MKILVTGFKPFLNEKINPSEWLAQMLAEKFTEVSSLILPVEFGRSFHILSEHLLSHNYNYVIMLGQAAGRGRVSLEKIALNWVQTDFCDEKDFAPKPGQILPEAALALMTHFPVDKIYSVLKNQNFPIEISFSAGTFVCNELYYRVLAQYQNLESVFVHVPLVEQQMRDQDVRPFLSLDVQLDIMSELIRALQFTAEGAIR